MTAANMSAIASSSWITFDIIENLIRRSKEDNGLKLKTFTVHEAIGKAENFCSNIVRVSATFRCDSQPSLDQTQNFIVKSAIEIDDFGTLNDEVNYFPKEIVVYEQILPEVQKLLLSIGDRSQIAPRYGMAMFSVPFP